MMKNPKFIVIDLFCGFGGTTTGYHLTNGLAKVIACVNHDPKAIKSHWLNYPDVRHFEEDIRTLDLDPLVDHLNEYKAKYPSAKIVLWASLECTNFSKAKGGLPREADSRTLACYLHRYIHALSPDIIKIENVVEFMAWGPLDENGKPISRRNGEDFVRWKNSICEIGYYDQWAEMNSANFGAYTSRNRLFGCFAKKGIKIAFPEPTHAKNVQKADLFANNLKPWKPVREVLHLDIEGRSIFNREKTLSEKTLERIYAGLIKFVAGGKDAFIAKYFSGNPVNMVTDIESPASTIRTHDCQALVKANFLSLYYGKGFTSNVNESCPTLTTKDRIQLITAKHFIKRDFSNGGESQSIETAAGSLMTNPKMDLVTIYPFIMDTQFGNVGKSINEPIGVITANRKYHYIVNPSYFGHCSSVDKPCPVIVARQDKAPLYLVDADMGMVGIEINENDSPMMIKIKEFMLLYGISDIKMRMLLVPELLKIQGFPEDYKMVGNQTDAKKFIGNSVVPHVVKAWTEKLDQVI